MAQGKGGHTSLSYLISFNFSIYLLGIRFLLPPLLFLRKTPSDIKTVNGPNPIPILSLDVKIVVDAPEAEEVTFTLVTNKKSKGKVKASSLPFTNFRSKILLILRAPFLFKTITTSIALKLAVNISAIVATKISKPA